MDTLSPLRVPEPCEYACCLPFAVAVLSGTVATLSGTKKFPPRSIKSGADRRMGRRGLLTAVVGGQTRPVAARTESRNRSEARRTQQRKKLRPPILVVAQTQGGLPPSLHQLRAKRESDRASLSPAVCSNESIRDTSPSTQSNRCPPTEPPPTPQSPSRHGQEAVRVPAAKP